MDDRDDRDDRVVLKSLANILGIINDVIPSDKKLTNEEKLDLIYGENWFNLPQAVELLYQFIVDNEDLSDKQKHRLNEIILLLKPKNN